MLTRGGNPAPASGPIERPTPANLAAEPGYPGLERETVLLSIASPEWTAHLAGDECPREEPHPTSECPLWGLGEPRDMATTTHVLDEEVRDALLRSTIREDFLVLPRPLDRKVYERVNKVLVLLGGTWNKARKAHVFQEEAEPVVSDALAAGTVVDLRAEHQFFETPDSTADRLVAMAGARSGYALEPSAGRGKIALALRRAGLEPDVCERWDRNRAVLLGLEFNLVAEDFLAYEPGPAYDVIVANPPFTRGQDMAHVTHMWDLLASGGRLVSVMSPAWTFRKTHQADRFRELVERVGGVWTLLDESAFAGNGAGARTGVLVLRKALTLGGPG